ncbi:MAG: hypothetical protein KC897_03570, partial [Candidatus Omnitrophica bacterium]|nr:hypothetical protein [Candidatus Omnitrophota bacterium]
NDGMTSKIEFYLIIGLIWVSASFYTGLLFYKSYIRSQQADESVKVEEVKSKGREELYSPVTTEKKWNARADQIRRDHRSLVDSYKQRQRDHQRLTRSLMRRNK